MNIYKFGLVMTLGFLQNLISFLTFLPQVFCLSKLQNIQKEGAVFQVNIVIKTSISAIYKN